MLKNKWIILLICIILIATSLVFKQKYRTVEKRDLFIYVENKSSNESMYFDSSVMFKQFDLNSQKLINKIEISNLCFDLSYDSVEKTLYFNTFKNDSLFLGSLNIFNGNLSYLNMFNKYGADIYQFKKSNNNSAFIKRLDRSGDFRVIINNKMNIADSFHISYNVEPELLWFGNYLVVLKADPFNNKVEELIFYDINEKKLDNIAFNNNVKFIKSNSNNPMFYNENQNNYYLFKFDFKSRKLLKNSIIERKDNLGFLEYIIDNRYFVYSNLIDWKNIYSVFDLHSNEVIRIKGKKLKGDNICIKL